VRVVFVLLGLASFIAMGASRFDHITNPQGYADSVSREFAAGDNGRPLGWRQCTLVHEGRGQLAYVCEGVRYIFIHESQLVDVNYYCEFEFQKVGSNRYSLQYSLCQ
jgi:hypothetical protein